MCCHQPLNPVTKKAYTAFETVDIVWADTDHPGLRLTNTKHTYYEITCTCGHVRKQQKKTENRVIYGPPRIARENSFVTKEILLPYIRPLSEYV